MKTSRIAIALCGAALLFSSGVLAGDANKGTLNLSESVSVEGKTINPGKYKVEWNGSGPDVQVSLFHGKDTIATFPAHLTEQPNQNNVDAYGSASQQDGTKTLTAIYIGGKHTVLELQSNGTAQQANTHGSK
jgi:hypothetical protein